MKLKKRLSKRKTLKLKYKIEKKVKEAGKKQRKEAKKQTVKQKKRDPGIPNSWPHKMKDLENAEKARAMLEQEKKDRKIQKKKTRQQVEKKIKKTHEHEHTLESSVTTVQAKILSSSSRPNSNALENLKNISQRNEEFEQNNSNGDEDNNWKNVNRQSRKTYVRELKKVVEMSDILLEILDARDPLGCRCPSLENLIDADTNKKLIIILNKIDLVPREAVQKWLAYFRQTHPTIAFKATTQHKGRMVRGSAVSATKAPAELLQSSECLGGDTLIKLLKSYSKSHNIKKAITVGVFGYPNVGKSSLINSLKRARAVGVSPCPGFTKTVTQVFLDKQIQLIDCPGVVFDKEDSGESSTNIVLRNAVSPDKVNDPIPIVEAIINRCDSLALSRHYKIAAFENVNNFLMHIARIRGKLLRGGVCDLESASRIVLQDWNAGKIPFFTLPPSSSETGEPELTIVGAWTKEFDISSLLKEEEEVLTSAQSSLQQTSFIPMKSDWNQHRSGHDDEDSEDDEDME
eukprot:c10134_g1_i1.p1 GENE.c10134_g1_i1~~c10134_g1_i1.p1  ORF type:complete len:516 (-),score=222.79 c10134_g1_i1:22-1569(-)